MIFGLQKIVAVGGQSINPTPPLKTIEQRRENSKPTRPSQHQRRASDNITARKTLIKTMFEDPSKTSDAKPVIYP